MSNYSLFEVKSRPELKKWVLFQHELYKDDAVYVPQVVGDEIEFFTDKNPVKEIADYRLFYVEKDGKIAGRVAAIIHKTEAEKLGYKRGRFGWLDFINDVEVVKLLLDEATRWFKTEKCKEITGPHGFTDLDFEGMLVEGFEELPTVSASYNFSYYPEIMEKLGFEKEIDYIEYKIKVPEEEPSFMARVKQRYADKVKYRFFHPASRRELMGYAPAFWEALEDAFKELYGVTPLSKKQQEYYTKKYLSYLDPEFVHLATDESGKVAGFFVGMPNVSRGFQKAKGKLFPFGIVHILRNLKSTDTADFLLAGVASGHPSHIVLPMLSMSMYAACKRRKIKYIETNRELESNTSVTGIWSKFESRIHRRSRIYRKPL